MGTLLLGLDGVCRPVLDPLFDDGALPALADLFGEATVSGLESQIPPWTPSAWPSLFTGVNPGKHGVFDFLSFEGYDWELVNRRHVREHALWELLDEHGLSSVVVNVPVTGPPVAFDGALIPGYVAPNEPTCHPEGLLDDVQDEVGDYRVYEPEDVDGGDEQVEWYERLVAMRGEAFRYLVDRFDPDFGFLQFQQTDTVFHERPTDRDAVRAVFEAVDEQVAAVLDACDPDTVVVASDHGIGPYTGCEFRANEYLRDRGLVATTRGEGGMPSWTSLARDRADDGGRRSLAEAAVSLAASVGVTSQRIATALERLGLKEFVLDHVSTDTVRAGTERVDFAESTAYMRSRTELGVRINKAGREPDGSVSPAEYPSVRSDVVSDLLAARAPDGTRVFEAVGPAEDYFHGPYVDDAPDVVTVPAAFDNYLSASLRGDVYAEPSEAWNHKRTGIVALSGDGVDESADLGDPHLFDVAPTVLATLGVRPSDRMDGRALPAVDSLAPTTYPEFDADPASSTESDRVKRQLSNLGYLDDDEY
ncbi:alkaline phosphatase family protein [Halobacterium litoreum]|uniref:Alkaline phosphatase family protein n=1 Tax=Halobacterium litoreum TaxID=2039234 RepID=A0ABD5NBB4_9EURY|nr:alkaline phosphatase family protein [Halobacterium litoreum]UHH14858.1 alkaline phosphatase family protein [Halobacterium litoreum]